jgi:hypothetical protein
VDISPYFSHSRDEDEKSGEHGTLKYIGLRHFETSRSI